MTENEVIAYARKTNKSLDEILSENSHMVCSNGKMTDTFGSIERLITAAAVYRLVQHFLQQELPVISGVCGYADTDVDLLNKKVVRDMRTMYVEGIGVIDISNIDTTPLLLTGQILSLKGWDYIAADVAWDNVDVYGSFNTIAEVIARYITFPYDITTMQIPQYEILRVGIDFQTSPTMHLVEGTTVLSRISTCMLYEEANSVNTCTTKDPEIHYDIHQLLDFANQTYNYVGLFDIQLVLRTIEDDIWAYNAKNDYYENPRLYYDRRTRTWDVVYGDILT